MRTLLFSQMLLSSAGLILLVSPAAVISSRVSSCDRNRAGFSSSNLAQGQDRNKHEHLLDSGYNSWSPTLSPNFFKLTS